MLTSSPWLAGIDQEIEINHYIFLSHTSKVPSERLSFILLFDSSKLGAGVDDVTLIRLRNFSDY